MGDILSQLPKLAYNPSRAGLSFWLAGLTWQKVRRLASTLSPSWRSVPWESRVLAESLQSRDQVPEDACFMGGGSGHNWSRPGQVTPANVGKDLRGVLATVFLEESVKEVAAALDEFHEVRCRYHRVRRKWRALTKGIVVLGHVIDVPTPKIPSSEEGQMTSLEFRRIPRMCEMILPFDPQFTNRVRKSRIK